MKFKQVVALDAINISESSLAELEKYSENPVRVYKTDPKDQTEIRQRSADADCILVSYRTPMAKECLDQCASLKYIGLCGTNTDSIDLVECKNRNIAVTYVTDYGDEGVIEFIILELLNLVRGIGKYQWQDYPAELNNKTVGIIGLGTVGKLLAKAALGLNMKVLYTSRTNNHEWEQKGSEFVSKHELLQKSDFVSLHTPKNVRILDDHDFTSLDGKILINTTLGKAFDEGDFINWIKKPNNYAIMDACPGFGDDLYKFDRVIYRKLIAGRTRESIERLSRKVLNNISAFLSNRPIVNIK